MSQALQNADVTTVCCRDDEGTEIVKHALNFALEGTVEVRAEDADILILLVYHYDDKIHNHLFFATSKGSFCINEIVKSLPDHKKKYILMCHSFTGCDTVSSFYGFSKEKPFERICNGNLDPILDVF